MSDTSDTPPDDRSVPDLFVTTLRVERIGPENFRASQHGTDLDGSGPTPHAAVIDYVRQAERACFGDSRDDPTGE